MGFVSFQWCVHWIDPSVAMATLYIPEKEIIWRRIVGVVHTLHHNEAAEQEECTHIEHTATERNMESRYTFYKICSKELDICIAHMND